MGRSKNLTKEERHTIHVDLKYGLKPSEIAKKLGRHRSCITKEISLNIDPDFKEYNYLVADNMSKKRMHDSRKQSYKINKIPKDILDKLFNVHMETNKLGVQESVVSIHKDDGYKISYSSIYRHIERDRLVKGNLYKYLPRKGKRYRQKASFARVVIKDKVLIDVRPDKSLLMLEAGHYEIDTIYGKDQESFLLTIVDIATLYTIIIKLENKESKTVENALITLFENSLLPLKSITSDNGGEFACHKNFKTKYSIEWFFCHPYCSWERGMNENTNGLIRRFYKKGYDFNLLTDAEIMKIQNTLNNRYRKRIGYRKPSELMVEMLQKAP